MRLYFLLYFVFAKGVYMAVKTDAEVIIGGKVFTLSGYESEEYLQKIAAYLNGKISENAEDENFKRLPVDTQAVLIELNIADDYFKARNQIEALEQELSDRDKELYDLKHELIATQIKMENMERNLKRAQEDATSSDKRVVELESRLKEKKN